MSWKGTNVNARSSSLTWNNSKWTLIGATSADWGGSDDGYSTNFRIRAMFGSIANLVKLTYTSSGSNAASSGFNVRGDFLTYYWWTRTGSSYKTAFQAGFFFTNTLYYWWTTPESSISNHGYQTFSIPSTKVTWYPSSTRYFSPWDSDSAGTIGGLAFYVYRTSGNTLNASYISEVWCKNLWLDTSVTVTKAADR